MIDMAFAKKRVDDRKLWLLALEPGKLLTVCSLILPEGEWDLIEVMDSSLISFYLLCIGCYLFFHLINQLSPYFSYFFHYI